MAIRPALLYVLGCWIIKKQKVDIVHVVKMQMLRRICEVISKHIIRNECVRGNLLNDAA